MEHYVQFAINIDDERIKQGVEQHAEKKIIENIENDVRKNLFDQAYGRGRCLNDFSEAVLVKYLDSCKDELLEIAAKYLAERLMRTKAVRGTVNRVLEEV